MRSVVSGLIVLVAVAAPGADFFSTEKISGQVSTLSAIYLCRLDRWPTSLEALRAVEAGAVAAGESPTSIPWGSIKSAEFEARSDGSLFVRLSATPDASVLGCPPDNKAVSIRVGQPDCRNYMAGVYAVCGPAVIAD